LALWLTRLALRSLWMVGWGDRLLRVVPAFVVSVAWSA